VPKAWNILHFLQHKKAWRKTTKRHVKRPLSAKK